MKPTIFYDIHKAAGAKLVDFAGFAMPVQYSSIINEHKAVRTAVGVFDVSHMGEVFVRGEKAAEFVQKITVNDVTKLFPGRVQYSAMCYHDGGIVDDLLVYKISDTEFFLVINASNIEKDVAWMHENNTFGVQIENKSESFSLLAVQGSSSRVTLEKAFGITLDMEYYYFSTFEILGKQMIVSRTGYTGELGYELYFEGDATFGAELWNTLFAAGAEYGITACGLGSRDSLRLEKGFCLYGNEIDATTNPLEAGLGWITKLGKGEFNGSAVLKEIKAAGLKRKLVAITTEGKIIPRHGYPVKVNGEEVGVVASGTMSPMLEKGIATAYVKVEFATEGTEIFVDVRGREVAATVVKFPFV